MRQQVLNPCLPENEYIPDVEPYIFGNRVYLYGSHDRFGAPMFCMNDYVCWSAPLDDLGNWKYEGVIYRKNQDPKNRLGLRLLFAPDVVRGTDGRYYLYYAFDFMGIMGVAVCESPCGVFRFLGHIRHADGTLYGRKKGDGFPFDPAVLVDDDKRIYLYAGFGTAVPAIVTGGKKLEFQGGYAMELEEDMLTIKGEPKLLFPNHGEDSFQEHEFFEASSIRKYDGTYYFVYSSRHNHELCLAVSDRPMEGFRFAGTLISNGDLFLNGNTDEEHAANYIGNNHGGLLKLKNEYYIIYHRQTNRSSYSRQVCAERIPVDENGTFLQAEMTSCGLNGGPLEGRGVYGARIACNLWSREGTGRYDCQRPKQRYKSHPYFTQEAKGDGGARQYIANMQDGSVAGFKYFRIDRDVKISVKVRGTANGMMRVYQDADRKQAADCIPLNCTSDYRWYSGRKNIEQGIHPVYFEYIGEGALDFLEWKFEER